MTGVLKFTLPYNTYSRVKVSASETHIELGKRVIGIIRTGMPASLYAVCSRLGVAHQRFSLFHIEL
jgi:hypothetical protein